jgi:hypothetical protein
VTPIVTTREISIDVAAYNDVTVSRLKTPRDLESLRELLDGRSWNTAALTAEDWRAIHAEYRLLFDVYSGDPEALSYRDHRVAGRQRSTGRRY